MAHARLLAASAAQDGDLVRAARAGDPVSLGVLLERYRARLFGLAVTIVGYRAEAEDAVHDTFVTALARLGELNDPAAVGGWLHAILRNHCLMELRARKKRPLPTEDANLQLEEIAEDARVEDRIESEQLRDWVSSSLGRLPEAIRLTMMLRYFGSFESYDEIASILGVPVGTVRSRLFDGKARLADLLLAQAGIADARPREFEEEREAFIVESFRELFRTGCCERFFAAFDEGLEIKWSGKRVTRGLYHLQKEIEGDFTDGVVMTPQRVLVNGNVTIVEGLFRNPPEDPFHCPPGLAMIFLDDGRRFTRMHLHLSPRPPQPAED